jgi:MraZ protein
LQNTVVYIKINVKVGGSGAKCHKVVDLKWQPFCEIQGHHCFRGRPGFKVVIVMFMSEYNHTIDAKGRLIIPSKFREVLGEEFVVSRGMDGCLFVYANDDWNAFEQKLTSLPLINKETRQFARFFLAGAAQVELDKQGRILLPAALREFAGLEKDVVLVGVGSRIEIWSKEKYEAISEDMDMDNIAAAMESLGLTI